MPGKYLTVENVSVLPKTAAKVAAAFLVLTSLPVTYAHDVQRASQAKVFSEPETFIAPQRSSFVTVLSQAPYVVSHDVQRASQAKVFSEPETYVRQAPQYSVVLATYATPPQTAHTRRAVFVETQATFKGQKSSLTVVLAQATFVPQPQTDVFVGNDTFGWPEESAYPPIFAQAQRFSLVILNSFPSYNPAIDRRALQAKYFGEPEIFAQGTHQFPVATLIPYIPAYNPNTDLQRRPQAKVFSDPEVFAQRAPQIPIATLIPYIPYNPATGDIQRITQAKIFSEPEVFGKPWPFNALVTNGQAAPPGPPVNPVWPAPSSITNLPVRGCWELPGGTQALWVVGSGVFLMTVKAPATSNTPATFNLARVGTLLTNSNPVCIRDNGAGGTAVIVDGPYGYYYTFNGAGSGAGAATGNFVRITDPNFQGADRVVFIDGWWVFNVPGTQEFYTPVSTYALTFNGTNFALKDGSTDILVTMYENKEELWLVGAKTTEVWYDAGGTYFAFARLVSTMLQVGCSAKNSIARFNSENEDGLIWLALSERGENVVVKVTGFTASVVSTPAVNHAIASYTVISDAIGYTYQEDGHEFYVLTFPSAQNEYGGPGATWVYDGTTDLWHQRLAYEPYAGLWYRHRSNCYLNFQDQRLVGDFENGSIYRMSRAVYTDNGWPLVAWRRAPHIWDGGARERIFMAMLQLEFKPGTGNSSGQGVNPQAILRISRDGGTTWGQQLFRNIGAIGQYLTRTIWRRLSFARDAVVEVKVYDPVNRDIVGATLKKAGDE